MALSLKRKLYPRGGSYETTIPLPLLLGLDLDKRNEVIFEYDTKTSRWYVRFESFKKSSNKSLKESSQNSSKERSKK